MAIALGERSYWGKGFGTDAMQIMLRYAFCELNLRSVGLIVFEYNPRAIRSYEKIGFVHEGRIRGAILREGKRWDFLYMGLLREEWSARQLNLTLHEKNTICVMRNGRWKNGSKITFR